jgi:hypothetical protein
MAGTGRFRTLPAQDPGPGTGTGTKRFHGGNILRVSVSSTEDERTESERGNETQRVRRDEEERRKRAQRKDTEGRLEVALSRRGVVFLKIKFCR